MSFTQPWLLLLLLAVPLVLLAGRGVPSRLRGARRLLVPAVRALLVALLALSLAGARRVRQSRELSVVFVVDVSRSTPTDTRARARQLAAAAAGRLGIGDRVGVVLFGAEPLVEQELLPRLLEGSWRSVPSPELTDVAAALRLGAALMPADRARRLVLITDGQETRGDAEAEARALAADGVELRVVPLPTASGPEMLLERVEAPPSVRAGEAFGLSVTARASSRTEALIRLSRDGRPAGQTRVTLQPGAPNVFTFDESAPPAAAPGEAAPSPLLRYEARLEPLAADGTSGDTVLENNVVRATVRVEGPPRLLYVEGTAGQSQHLEKALAASGIPVEVAAALPEDLPALAAYDGVVLSDVAATSLSSGQLQGLELYVRELGRGLAMMGGPDSFGPGGYYRTPVERALPVNMDVTDKQRFPPLGLVLVIDKSGSMAGVGRASKMGLAKEAAVAVVELLTPRDQLGVIAFDSLPSWALPLRPLRDKPGAVEAISRLEAGGGTEIYPALEQAYDALAGVRTSLQHIVLLSDGQAGSADYERLARAGAEKKVSLSTVAIGEDADKHTLSQLAEWGKGRAYATTDPESLPQIFTREAQLASRSFVIEEPFVPRAGVPDPVTAGVADGKEQLPQLGGYVATSLKPRASKLLAAREGDPLLATWRYGLGRAAAWTSDVKARWATRWLGTAVYGRLFGQLATFLAPPGARSLRTVAEIDRSRLRVTVEAEDGLGAPRNFLRIRARLVRPDGTTGELELEQTGPGRYQAEADASRVGSYLVATLAESPDGTPGGQGLAEAQVPYSPELGGGARLGGPSGAALLARLASIGGQPLLDWDRPAEAAVRPLRAVEVGRDLWPALLVASMLLLLLEVALRRVTLPAQLLARIRPAPRAPAATPRPAAATTTVPATVAAPAAETAPAPTAAVAGTPLPDTAPGPDGPVFTDRLLAAKKKGRGPR